MAPVIGFGSPDDEFLARSGPFNGYITTDISGEHADGAAGSGDGIGQ